MRLSVICVLFASAILSACQSIPNHEVVQLRKSQDGVVRGGWRAMSQDPDNVTWKPVQEMNTYICRHPREEQKLIEFFKRQCQK